MSDAKISLFERYVLEGKAKFFASLVPNSEEYNYYYLLDALNENGLKLTGEVEKKLTDYVKKNQNNTSDLVVLKYNLLKMDATRSSNNTNAADLKKKMRDFDELYLKTKLDYARPVAAGNQREKENEGASTALPAQVDVKQLTSDSIVKKAIDCGQVNELNSCGICLVDLKAALNADSDGRIFRALLDELPTVSQLERNLVPMLLEYDKKCKANESNGVSTILNEKLVSKMTLKQVEELVSKMPTVTKDSNFVILFFKKRFASELSVLEERSEFLRRSYEELHAMYEDMNKWAENLPDYKDNKCLASLFVRQMLVLDLDHNKVDKAKFMDYLKRPTEFISMYKREWNEYCRENFSLHRGAFQNVLCNFPGKRVDDSSLLKEYLMNIFSQNPNKIDVSPYEKFFERSTLTNLAYRAKLFAGLEVSPSGSELSDGELQELQTGKQLQFARWCRRYFVPGERTELELQLKNITHLTVRVFEIQTENYYDKFRQEVDERVSLDGLVPRRCEEHTFDQAPAVRHEFVLPDVTGSGRGVFVVECVGSGAQCRAVVRVGALTLIRRAVSKGVIFYMVDEAKQVCRSDTTRMRLRGKEYRPSAELGHGMFVPYGVQSIDETAVLCHEGFADLCKVRVPAETATVDMTVLVHEGTVAESGYTKLLVTPQVRVCGNAVSASVLRNVEICVRSADGNGVRGSQVLRDVDLSGENAMVEVSYLVPPLTEELSVEMRAQVYSMSKEEWEDVVCTREVRVERLRRVRAYADVMLRQEADGRYALHFVGRDGESYAGMKVRVKFVSHFTTKVIEFVLQTDANGVIDLGKAGKYASAVQVMAIDTPSPEVLPERVYDLNSGATCSQLSSGESEVTVVAGEKVVLPGAACATVEGLATPFELVRVSASGAVLTRHTSAVKVVNGAYSVEGLGAGRYLFFYTLTGKRVKVEVLEGRRWDVAPEQYVEQRNSIVELGSRGAGFAVGKTTVAADGSVEILLNGCGAPLSDVRVHAFAYTYYPTTLGSLKQCVEKSRAELLQCRQNMAASKRYTLSVRENVFLKQSQVDQETKYILDRKRQRKTVGNTLERPPGLLKRHLVRDTQESEQPDYKEDLLETKDRAVLGEVNAMKCCAAPACFAAAPPQSRAPQGQMYGMSPQLLTGTKLTAFVNRQIPPYGYYVEALTGFLKHSGWSQFNLTPDGDTGVVRFTVPADCKYRTLVYVVQGVQQSVVGVAGLAEPEGAPAVQPVVLKVSREANRVYVTERRCANLQKSDQLSLSSSAAFFLVDSVAAVSRAMQLICPDVGLEGKWSFLSQWGSLTPLQKLEKYDELLCHEFHWFVYLKDREFFDAVVRPHLESKSRKQLMDWLLLENRDAVKRYLEPVPASTLTCLEKALIVRLLSETEPELCQELARGLLNECKAQERNDTTEHDHRFDCVLSGNTEAAAASQPGMGAMYGMGEGMRSMYAMGGPMGNMGAMYGGTGEGMGAVYGGMGGPMGNMGAMYGGTGEGMGAVYGGMGGPMDGVGAVYGGMRVAGGDTPGILFGGVGDAPDANIVMNNLCNVSNAAVERTLARRQVKRYRPKDVTREYEETQFASGKELPVIYGLRFWASVAAHYVGDKRKEAFVSENFMYAADNLTESVMALALLDVPLQKGEHDVQHGTDGMTVQAGGCCMVFYRALEEKGGERSDELKVVMSQRFADPDDRAVYDPNKKTWTAKTVREFLVGKLYESHVSVTNIADGSCDVRLVTEVPQGSVPVLEHEFTKEQMVHLEPLQTHVVEFYFYFPRAGSYTCMPASVNHDGKLACVAGGVGEVRVVTSYSEKVMETLSDILSQGSPQDVLAFIEANNWYDRRVFAPQAVYWLLNNESFYRPLLKHLRSQRIFDATVWSFSVYHGDYDTFREYLQHLKRENKLRSPVFTSTLYLSTDALSLDEFEYKEYSPLANARVHDVGRYAHNIRNDAFRETYEEFLRYWIEKSPRDVTAKDRLFLTTYLLLQDRVEEALTQHGLIDAGALAAQGARDMALQYDYLTAYLDVYRGGPEYKCAREVCARYLTYPVFEWRNRFVDVLNLLAECRGEADAACAPSALGKESDATKNLRETRTEPSLSCEVKPRERQVVVTAGQVPEVRVSLYEVDLELLFSKDPFMDIRSLDYSYVTANWEERRQLGGGAVPEVIVVDVPADLRGKNLVVRVDAGRLSETLTLVPCDLHVQVQSEYGVVKVTELLNPLRPVPRVYVKAYAQQQDGTVKFFKDGYTDLRGCMEYTSVNHTTDFSSISKFSLLVLSDERGAALRQTTAPSGLGELAGGARELRNEAMRQQQLDAAKNSKNPYCIV